MSMLFEYYLTGGKLRIGKKELAFELLRKDSALRFLLGYGAGKLKSLAYEPLQTDDEGDFAILDFSRTAERKLSDDPTRMLNELKRRYGSSVGGKLYFKSFYTTFGHSNFLEADLDANEISLHV